MYIIEIEKNRLPYNTQIEINGELFILEFKYNLYDERVYCSLYDINGVLLADDEPITNGQIMFARYYIDAAGNFRNGFPKAVIVPNYYDSAKKEKMVYNNISEWALFVEEI